MVSPLAALFSAVCTSAAPHEAAEMVAAWTSFVIINPSNISALRVSAIHRSAGRERRCGCEPCQDTAGRMTNFRKHRVMQTGQILGTLPPIVLKRVLTRRCGQSRCQIL